MSLQQLREEYNALAIKARALVDVPKDKWTKASEAETDTIYAEMDVIEAQIKRHEGLLKRTDNLETSARSRAVVTGRSVDEEAHVLSVGRQAFRAFAQYGDKAGGHVSDEVQAVLQTGFRNAAVAPASAGGYIVETEVAGEVLIRLKAYGGVRQVATSLTTAGGNPLLYPTTDDTANTGELVAETVAAATQDVTFGGVTINAYRFSSKIIPVSLELLQDTAIDVEGLILGLAATRLGRITNTNFTVGTGVAQPQGLLTAANLGKTGLTGQTTAIIYDDLVDLEHSVDPAYRRLATCGWMFHDTTLRVLKKLKDSMGRPLWRPAVSGVDSDNILGYRYTINQDMPIMAASAKSVLFGDFSRHIVRDSMAVTLFRFTDSIYMSKGQIGFLAMMRADSRWTDSGNSALSYYANSAT